MEGAQIAREVRSFLRRHELVLWEDFPWDAPIVLWPEDGTLESFLDVIVRVQPQIIYLEEAGEAVGFAVGGVVHGFFSDAARLRQGAPLALEEWLEGSDSETADDEDEFRSLYYDFDLGRVVTGQLREVVDRIVNDPRYDAYRTPYVVIEHVEQLNPQEAETAESVAQRVFLGTIGKELDQRAKSQVPHLVQDVEFDPFAWGDAQLDFLEARLPDEDPRVISRLSRELPDYANTTGLVRALERDMNRWAKELLKAFTPIDRDAFGFATTYAKRLQIAREHIEHVPENRRTGVLGRAASLEEADAAKREARYATAARGLMDLGQAKAEVSRRLGISTAVIDRLLRTYRTTTPLAPDDPIVADLAPELA